jgi:hypothetical protein
MCGDDDTGGVQSAAQGLFRGREERESRAFGTLFPWAQERLKEGLPEFAALTDFSRGTLARNTGQGRNAILRSATQAGMNPNDPAVLQQLADFEASRGASFDDLMVKLIMGQDAARSEGARYLAAAGGASDPVSALGIWRDIALS